jgi:hypothetical protein
VSPELLVQVAIQAAAAIAVAFSAYHGMRFGIQEAKRIGEEAERKALAAHKRIDEEEQNIEDLTLEVAKQKASMDTRVAVAESEIRTLRGFRHDFPNTITGPLGNLQHEIDLLKDALAVREQTKGPDVR